MEIYRNDTTTKVHLAVPVTASGTEILVQAVDYAGNVLYDFSQVFVSNAEPGGYYVTLPFELVDQDRDFTINWQFDYLRGDGTTRTYKARTAVSVVTPYATVADVRANLVLPNDTTDADITRLEGRIRKIIENYTGQKFGQTEGSKLIYGTGDKTLRLPEPLVSLENITGSNVIYVSTNQGYLPYYAIYGDGWSIGVAMPDTVGDGDWVFTNVIRDPEYMWTRNKFLKDVPYTVTGIWGYSDVPADVREAALILIEDQLCPDKVYREKFVEQVQWGQNANSLQFFPTAFVGTGNIIANQLLDAYVRTSMTVI